MSEEWKDLETEGAEAIGAAGAGVDVDMENGLKWRQENG